MAEPVWIKLSRSERKMLIKALSEIRESHSSRSSKVDALALKLAGSDRCPKITIGVERGQVQWTTGNPFPVWICDYDGEEADLPHLDRDGRRCRIWSEPPQAA